MGNTLNVVEEGFIKCACGGKVTLKSTVAGLTIGGKKPLYWKDLLNAPVACPRSSKQNPCTKVAAITSVGTEPNVGANGEPYLLRTDGFVTDKGRPVILVDPGQYTSKILAPPSTKSEFVEEEKPSEAALKEAKENIAKEKYKLYLIRPSKDNKNEDIYKPLRASRNFMKTENFYSKDKDINPRIKDKIYTALQSYVYIKTAKNIDEYKVVSKGTLCAENLNEISYKNEKNIPSKYIPLNDDKDIEIFYTNVKLRKSKKNREADLKNFEAIPLNPKTLVSKKEKAFYIKDIQSLKTNEITKEDIQTQKKFDPLKIHEKNSKLYPLNVVCTIEDELGIIEDLYQEYESTFKLNFVKNEDIIDDIRDKNAYVYNVASQINYFYVSEERKEKYNKNIKKLSSFYSTFVREVLYGKLSDIIIEDKSFDLADIVVPNFDVSSHYYNQIEFLNKSFFINKKIELYNGQLKFINNNLNYYYNPNETHADIDHKNNIISKNIEERGINRAIHTAHGYLKFSNYHDDYKTYRENPNKLLALLVFSILFSGDYDEDIRAIKGLEDKKIEFYNLLINMRPLPPISDNDIEDIDYMLKDQKLYKDMFEGSTKKSGFIFKKEHKDKNTLLAQFDNLEYIHKKVSFSYDEAKKINIQTALEFEDLYRSKHLSTFEIDKSLVSPDKLLKRIVKQMQSTKVKTLLSSYVKLKEFENNTTEVSYHYYMLNIAFAFVKLVAYCDEEQNILTPFNTSSKHILDFMEKLTVARENIQDMNEWADYRDSKKLFFETYSLVLNSVVTHSCIQNGQNNIDKKFEERQTNALSFLNKIGHLHGLETKINFTFSKEKKKNPNQSYKSLIANNFDIGQKSQDTANGLYNTLNAINGFTKRLADVNGIFEEIKALKNEELALKNEIDKLNNDSSQRKHIKKKRKKEIVNLIEEKQAKINKLGGSTNYDDLGDDKRVVTFNISKFKKTLASTKALSNVVALIGVSNYYNSYEKLKLSNLTAFASDVSTLSILALEGLEKAKNNVKLATTLISQTANKAKLNIGAFAYRLDIFITIIAGVSRFTELDKEDIDGKAVTAITSGLQVIFLLRATWVGFAVAGATELAYQLILNFTHIINSPIENYINKSLLYKTKMDNEYKFKTTILNRTLKGSSLKIPIFNTFKDIQNFIGDNYDKNKGILDSALLNEISVLKKTLFGLELELYSNRMPSNNGKITKSTGVKIPNKIFKDKGFKLIMINNKNEYNLLENINATENSDYQVFDLLNKEVKIEDMRTINGSKNSLIVITENISLKYEYSFYTQMNDRAGMNYTIQIPSFKDSLLNSEDEKYIGTITND